MLLLFSFYTGVRTFSLIQTEKTSDYSKVEDVVVLKRSPFEFTIQFNVKNLKCFSGALTRGIKQNWLLHSVTKWSGFAARSVVDALRDIDDAYGLTAPQGSSKAARIEKLKIDRSTKLTDQEEEDLEKDPKLVEADKQFHAAVKRLSRLTAHGTLLQRQDSQFNLR
ncbi:unnamed protein product [Tilletia controversa]|nr:unnamed protein product [Tilletia controversa]